MRRLTLYTYQPASLDDSGYDLVDMSGMFDTETYQTLRHIQIHMNMRCKVFSILNPWLPALECVDRYQHATSSHTFLKDARAREQVLAITITCQLEVNPTLAELREYTDALLATNGVQRVFLSLREGGIIQQHGCY